MEPHPHHVMELQDDQLVDLELELLVVGLLMDLLDLGLLKMLL